jgi:hypothetical protein
VIAGSDAFEQSAEEIEVHPADELALLLGEAVERIVGEGDLVVGADHRLVTVKLEDADHLGAAITLRRDVTRDASFFADLSSGGACGDSEAVAYRCSRVGRLGNSTREQRSGKVVVAIGY